MQVGRPCREQDRQCSHKVPSPLATLPTVEGVPRLRKVWQPCYDKHESISARMKARMTAAGTTPGTWFHSVTAASAVDDPVFTTSPNLSAPSCFLVAPRHACRLTTDPLALRTDLVAWDLKCTRVSWCTTVCIRHGGSCSDKQTWGAS